MTGSLSVWEVQVAEKFHIFVKNLLSRAFSGELNFRQEWSSDDGKVAAPCVWYLDK